MSLKLTRDDVKTLLILLCLVLDVSRSYLNFLDTAFIYYLIVSLSTLTFLYSCCRTKVSYYIKEIIFLLIYEFTFFTSISFNQNLTFSYPILTLRYIFLAFVITQTNLNKKYLKFVLLLFQAFCLFIIKLGMNAHLENFFMNRQNAVSAQLILFNSLYLLAYDDNKAIEEVMLTSVSFVISLIAGGRSGIIALAILVLASFVRSGKKLLEQYKRFMKCLLYLLIIFTILFLNREASVFSYINTRTMRFSATGNTFLYDSSRSMIIEEYLAYAFSDFKLLIWGVKLDKIPIVKELDGNPHNSFVYLHAHFGLLGILLILYFTIKAFVFYLKNRDRRLLILLCIILRAFTDIVAFPGIYDVLFWYLVLTAVHLKKGISECSRKVLT